MHEERQIGRNFRSHRNPLLSYEENCREYTTNAAFLESRLPNSENNGPSLPLLYRQTISGEDIQNLPESPAYRPTGIPGGGP